MAETVENVSRTAESPPIASLLPLLQLVLTGSSRLFHLGVRFLLTLVYPLRITWSIVHALLSPIFVVVNIAFAIVLSTPFSIIRMVVVALYPVYAFCAVACIIGALVGILGHYISTAILSVLSRSTYFTRPPGASPATRPSSPQAMLRKRKRKSVRLQ
ncbi:hypothetical protein J3R82DRAFT_8646 [Butyriboletus roseoflavus]|nr:hypothetical protein J3R82DRAFT_8646 [Butyriboletus roseoflavus]